MKKEIKLMKKSTKRKLKRLLRYPRKIRQIEGITAYLWVLDSILNREVERSVTINGYTAYIRTNSVDLDVAVSCFANKEYEGLRLSEAKIIIDAGANIGTSSIFFAEKFPDARIFAIEPESSNFKLLEKNIKKYPNIIPIKAAIWGKSGTRSIVNRGTGHWGYTVSETTNQTSSTGQETHCVTIDSIMQDYGVEKIDLLKIDIEGGEKDVLENSKNWINLVDVMTVELHDRINMGCVRAFYLATQDFKKFEKNGEKITAYK